jgi:hypothetical protein
LRYWLGNLGIGMSDSYLPRLEDGGVERLEVERMLEMGPSGFYR